MNAENRLKKRNKKTISLSELGSILYTGSDAELCNLVSDAVNSGILTLVKSSGTNGNRAYPLYLKYRIAITEDYSDALSEIAILHPAINKTGYLNSKPEMYVKFRAQLQKIITYLFKVFSGSNKSYEEVATFLKEEIPEEQLASNTRKKPGRKPKTLV